MELTPIKYKNVILLSILMSLFIFSGIILGQNQVADNVFEDKANQQQNEDKIEPQTQYYGDHPDYIPIGANIQAPIYFHRYVGQANYRELAFRLRDYYNEYFYGFFSEYRVFVDGGLQSSGWWPGDQISYDPNPFLSATGVHTILFQVKHNGLNLWLNHTAILNVTNGYHAIQTHYDSFTKNRYSGGYLEYYVARSADFSYSFLVDGMVMQSDSGVTYSYLSFSFGSIINTNNLGLKQCELRILDNMGYASSNKFNVTIVPPNTPFLDEFSLNNNNQNFFLWETQNARFRLRGADSDNDMDRIDVFVMKYIPNHGEYPVLFNRIRPAVNWQNYEPMIDSAILSKLATDPNQNQYRFRAIAVDNTGKSSTNWKEASLNLQNTNVFGNADKKEFTAFSGRNVETLTTNDPRKSSLSYTITVVVDVTEQVKVNLFAMTADEWHKNGGMDGHCRENNGECTVFEGKSYEGEWLHMGVMFWINVDKLGAVVLPIIIKIQYPSSIEPNPDFDEAPLRLLKWKSDWSTSEEPQWQQRDNGELRKVDTSAIEFDVFEFGLYGYGMDSLDYRKFDNKSGIPGYPIEIFISFMAIGALITLWRFKKRN